MSTSRFIIGAVLILIGISSLTSSNLLRYIFPILIILLGWSVLTNRRWSGNWEQSSSSAVGDNINEFLVFTGIKRDIKSAYFTGGKIGVIFAGADLDMTDVKPSEKIIQLELLAVFGGIRLKVPENWKVTSEAVSVLGGVDNKTNPKNGKTIQLKITGAAIFGGIEINS